MVNKKNCLLISSLRYSILNCFLLLIPCEDIKHQVLMVTFHARESSFESMFHKLKAKTPKVTQNKLKK